MIARDQTQLRAAVREAVEKLAISQTERRESIPLSEAEIDALRRGGIPEDAITGSAESAMARTRHEYERLLLTSLSVVEVAKALRTTPEAVVACLEDRKLYGVKLAGEWRLPRFQFQDGKLLPGIKRVIGRLDPRLHPLAVHNWFVYPEPDLEVGEDAVSPREWLLQGGSPREVAELAAWLGRIP